MENLPWNPDQHSLALQFTGTCVLAETATLREALPKILQTICECLNWDLGAVWQAQLEQNSLRCVEIWSNPSLAVQEFAEASREITFAAGVGLPGRVWANGQPATIPEAPKDPNFPRADVAARVGLLGGFAFPIQAGGDVPGVMEVLNRTAHSLQLALLILMAMLGGHV